MAVSFRTFVQILMAVLALGVWMPQSACAAGTTEEGKTCCCTQSPTCECPPAQPCKESCVLAQVQIFDKQLSGRNATAPTAPGYLHSAIASIKVGHSALVPLSRERETNASLLFGGNPPQARLCLWLI